jgi:hypothetical protein
MGWVERPVRASWFSSGPGHSACGGNKLKNSGYFTAFQYLAGHGQIPGDCQPHELACGEYLGITNRCSSLAGFGILCTVWSHGPACINGNGYCGHTYQRAEPRRADMTPAAFRLLSIYSSLGAGILPTSVSYSD